MYKGIYIAVSGAVLSESQLAMMTQNLANSNTAGFKKDGMSFQQYLLPEEAAGPGPDGRAMTSLSECKTDFSNGVMMKTVNPLDIALEGTGFIALEDNRYTRRGDLKRNADGFLTSFAGTKVLGSKGPIKLPNGKIDINEKGQISVNNEIVDTIKIVDFKKTNLLVKAGDSLFMTNENAVAANANVRQGYVESSNVEPLKEMVKMLEALRDFETYQKAIQMFDEATSEVTTDMGRL